jgi:hypothetical protein
MIKIFGSDNKRGFLFFLPQVFVTIQTKVSEKNG